MTHEPPPVGAIVDTKPAPRPGRTTIEGRRVAIVPFDVSAHARDLFELSSGTANEDLWAYLGHGPFPDLDSFVQHYAVAATKDDPLLYAIIDRTSGRAVGHVTYLRIAPADRAIEVGNILFTPALQRSAAATEAMYLMARHAFDDLRYRRYEWKCNALNAPSRRAAARLGFTYEGTFRQHMIVKGRNRDTAWFSVLDHEWPAIRTAFESWLAADNFDTEGRQRRRLEDFRS